MSTVDWEGLQDDLLALILTKIKLIEDFVAFGMVCKSWHKGFTLYKKGSVRRPQIPWLMLPENKADDDHRRIFTLSKQNILRNNLYIPEMSDKRCIGLNYGWVLTIKSGVKGEMSLVHPLSRSQIELPPQNWIAEYKFYKYCQAYNFMKRAALSADPLESPSDSILMILHSGAGGRYLGYWKPGDREWTRVEWTRVDQLDDLSDLTYYHDQFYAINYRGGVWSYKVSSHDHDQPPRPRQIIKIEYSTLVGDNWPYIVGVGKTGTLLVLLRQEEWGDRPWGESGNYWVADFQVYELDLINQSYKQIKNIGDRAIFVGENTSICLDHVSQFPGVDPNHIYYTDDHYAAFTITHEGGGEDMGSYDLENGHTMPIQIEESLSSINPPFWFMPSL